MLGDLVSRLDRPGVAEDVLSTLDPQVVEAVGARAAAYGMSVPTFVADGVRAFIDEADDDLWFQLITVMRKAEDPGLAGVQAIITWMVTLETGAR